MTAPRWTIDDDGHGDPAWDDGVIWTITRSDLADRLWTAASLASCDNAWLALVQLVRDADTLTQARRFAAKVRDSAGRSDSLERAAAYQDLLELLTGEQP